MNNIESIVIDNSVSIRDALAKLDETALSVLLLVDFEGGFVRTVTDGDLRRLILSGLALGDSLCSLTENGSVVIREPLSDDAVLSLMDKHEINQVPYIDEQNKPVGVYLRHQLKPRVQLSIPHMGDHELGYVHEAFNTNWIAPLGPNVDAFETEIAEYVGIGHAAALSSGTAAIHLALRLLGVEAGDTVLCSSFTFVASANPILYQAAKPVFIDSEPATWNMSPIALANALQDLASQGVKPKAILVVHLYGQSADMDSIMALSREYDVPVIEDAAESLGASYKGQHTGTFGAFGVFSFNGNKIITTSGGGMLISNDGQKIDKARFLATQARDDAPHYQHSEIGYNYRMSNVLAGIGRGQLKVLDDRVRSRRAVFDHYKKRLGHLSVISWMPEPEGDFSNRWLSSIKIESIDEAYNAKALIAYLADHNIEARHLWKPMHCQPLFDGCTYYEHEGHSYCDELFKHGLCLPSASNMDIKQQDRVIDCILAFFN